ncbi:MAG: hypothetical protein IJR68_12585, partial [Fretibacterium sp.]|nr:hypothetical protein [Fretibacterium sp.]
MHRVLRIAEPAVKTKARTIERHLSIGLTIVRTIDAVVPDVQTELTADLPAAEPAVEQIDLALDVVDANAKRLELIVELNNELLEHLNILLAGLGHIDHCERAGESGSHL